MKKRNKFWTAVAVLALAGLVGSPVSAAEREWTKLASLNAGKDPEKVGVNQQISKVSVTCTSGTMVLASVTVVSGGQKYEFKVGNKLTEDQSQQITVGRDLSCESLLIAAQGTATYDVSVRN